MASLVDNQFNIEDVHLSESEKNDVDYLRERVDYFILSLVREKEHIRKARNLYDGRRDKKEFEYLEQTFGIETPIAVKMTPLIKTRVDVLIGLLLDEVYTYHIAVNDSNTLDQIDEKRKAELARNIIAGVKERVKKNFEAVEKNEQANVKAVDEIFISKIEKTVNSKFVSEFEIAAQALIKFFEQDRGIDLRQKMKQFLLDLILTGEAYFRTYVPKEGEDPILEICKAENIFYSKNNNHQFLSSGAHAHTRAIVHREFMSRNEILEKYGHLMDDIAKSRVFGNYSEGMGRVINDPRKLDYVYNWDSFYDESNGDQHRNSRLDTLPVYHVEWLANNEIELSEEDRKNLTTVEKSKINKIFGESHGNSASGEVKKKGYRLDRYEGIRIGYDVYLNLGKSKNIPRSSSKEWSTVLSYNGAVYNDRNGKPYSLALGLKDLQDSYDIIMFFRDNLIATAGVDGSRINLAAIPKVLGQDYMERILKFMALRKQGVEIYDPTEDGAHLFNHYGDFRGSINGNIIESLNTVLESIERQADIVSGVNRHMYAAAEVRDAVSNVQVGQKQVSLITKDMFELVHHSHINVLTDLINCAKRSYRKGGKRGSYILGHRTILFNVLPENFCYTDYNIQIVNSSKENFKVEKLKALLPELVAAQVLPHETLVKIALKDSTTEIMQIVESDMEEQAAKNDQLGQLSSQLEQLQGQLAEYDKQLKNAEQQINSLESKADEFKNKELQLKEKELQHKIEIDNRNISVEVELSKHKIEKDKAVVQLEREQLYADNVRGNAREIKNDI
jgi:hypothetical protein